MKTHLRYFPPTIFTIKLKSLLKSSVILILRVNLNTINSITDVSELLHCSLQYGRGLAWRDVKPSPSIPKLREILVYCD